MKVAFVGASGRVGRQVAPFLRDEFELTLFGLRAETLELDGRNHAIGALDITDFAACAAALGGFDGIVNCAINDPTQHRGCGPEALQRYHEGCIAVNALGAYNLYQAATQHGARDFTFISSLTAQMGLPAHQRIGVDSAVRPVNLYACTKLFGEQVGQLYASRDELRVKCLRLGQPYRTYGPFDERWPYAPPRTRGVMVAAEDIARAIKAALTAPHIGYGAYPIVSHSDDEWIDPDAAREIGYQPIYDFQPFRLLRAGVEIESWPAQADEEIQR